MELLVATAIGTLTGTGLYLMLRRRTFPVILGLTLLSYAVNVFLFASGRLKTEGAAILPGYAPPDPAAYADPLPQALVLTAIVISFGMTAVILLMALGAWLEDGDEGVDAQDAAKGGDAAGGGA